MSEVNGGRDAQTIKADAGVGLFENGFLISRDFSGYYFASALRRVFRPFTSVSAPETAVHVLACLTYIVCLTSAFPRRMADTEKTGRDAPDLAVIEDDRGDFVHKEGVAHGGRTGNHD